MIRLVVVCLGFDTLQYRVLRCAADAADEVHALGPASSRRITASRYLTGFHPASSGSRTRPRACSPIEPSCARRSGAAS